MTPEREQELIDKHARAVAWIAELKEEQQSEVDFYRCEDPVRARVEEKIYDGRIAAAAERKDRIINILAGKEPDDPLI